jgi:hypothetical protein
MYTRILTILIWLLCLGLAQAQTLTMPSTGTVGQSISASVTFSSDGIVAVNGIEWGDGGFTAVTNGANGSSKNFSHTYSNTGNFRAKLTCWRPKNSKTSTRQKLNTLQQSQSDPVLPASLCQHCDCLPDPDT